MSDQAAAAVAHYDVDEDVTEIDFTYLTQNVDRLDHVGLYNLAYGHLMGDVAQEGIEPDHAKAVEYAERSFELSGKSYQPPINLLGLCHQYELGVPRNYLRAFGLFNSAHQRGLNDATLNLGVMRYYGHVGEVMHDEAFALISQAHSRSPEDPVYSFDLGLLYVRGHGVAKSEERARSLFEVSAKNGLLDAKAELANCYAYGVGGPIETLKALELYSELVDAKHPYGFYAFAIARLHGVVVKKDVEAGMKFLKISADMGTRIAQYHLAVAYREGKFVKKDPQEYTRYLELACAQGYPSALAEREHLSSYLFENIDNALLDTKLNPTEFDYTPVEQDIEKEHEKPPAVGRKAKRVRMNKGTPTQIKKVSFPPDLVNQLNQAAAAEGVSFSRYIVQLCEQAVEHEHDDGPELN